MNLNHSHRKGNGDVEFPRCSAGRRSSVPGELGRSKLNAVQTAVFGLLVVPVTNLVSKHGPYMDRKGHRLKYGIEGHGRDGFGPLPPCP